MSLRENKKHRTVTAILDAATEVLAERGVESAPVDLIARRAGVAVGTIYTHFGSKDDVRAAAIEHAARVIIDATVAPDLSYLVKTPLERLALCGRAYTRAAFEHPREFRLLAHAVLVGGSSSVRPRPSRSSDAVRRLTDLLVTHIDDGVHAGEITPTDAGRAAGFLLGAWTGVLSMSVGARATASEVAQASAMLDAAATALASGARPPRAAAR